MKVRSYDYAHTKEGEKRVYEKHESELPYVQPASQKSQLFDALPIINAEDVHPVNIALWPAALNRISEKRLVVQIDPLTNEI